MSPMKNKKPPPQCYKDKANAARSTSNYSTIYRLLQYYYSMATAC